MKITLILIASFILGGCAAGPFPSFPESIINHYIVDVRDEEIPAIVKDSIENPEEIPPTHEVVRCIKFDIVSKIPYRIKFVSEVPMKECSAVGGYKPSDFVTLYNWVNDVYEWAKDRKKCFK